MSAEDILDNWFGGHTATKGKATDPRELLKDLPPVSLNGRRDFSISIEIAHMKGTKFELKYPAWGFYPRHELTELMAMIKIYAIQQLIVAKEPKPIKPIEMPEHAKHKSRLREKSFHDFMTRRKIA